ncbi:hypothetical protein [Rhodococcus sp. BH4]|nr:hypothetical protein [Rhodococcus sp. BH4]
MSPVVLADCDVAEVVEDQLAGLCGEEFVDQLCAPQPRGCGGLAVGART